LNAGPDTPRPNKVPTELHHLVRSWLSGFADFLDLGADLLATGGAQASR
jgi:hypothetical protein